MQAKTIQNWQPPEGYRQVDSGVEGVVVYAPHAEEDQIAEKVTYKCPQCGATTRYDVNILGVSCEHCGYSLSANSTRVGTEASQFEFTLETLDQAEHGWGAERSLIHCDSCGAEIVIKPGFLTATCPFCASNQVNVRKALSDKLRPRFLIPFKITEKQVRDSVKEWLAKGWFKPKELNPNLFLDRFLGLYLPFWTFDARIDASWRAEVGRTRTVRDRNGHTRTVVDWHWQNGSARLNVDDHLTCGSKFADQRILQKIYPFALNDLETYSPDYLAGWNALAYDLNLPEAWEAARQVMREEARKTCRGQIHSAHVRNFSMNADFADETWRYVLLPVYLASFKYGEKVFQVMVNGQNGKLAGQKPVSWQTIILVVAALLSPGILLSLLGLVLVLAAGIGMIPLTIGIVLFVIGLVTSIILVVNGHQTERG